MNSPVNRRRIRFIERDYIFQFIKQNSKYLTENDINKMLDELDWADYTFVFDIKPESIKTVIIDNKTGLDVALIDLNDFAKQFYHVQILKIKNDSPIERIRGILKMGRAV